MLQSKLSLFLFIPLIIFSCKATDGEGQNPGTNMPAHTGKSFPLETIIMPEGFEIEIYAEVDNARSLCLSPSGTLFVSNRGGNKVYAVRDLNGDGKGDSVYVIDKGLRMPNGVAFKDGDLYVAEVSRILRYKNIEANLHNPPKPEVVYDQYPSDRHHGWKYIAFGPDGMLYVPVGAPCNICNSEKAIYASITKLDVNNPGDPEIIASGVRNTVGFAWHPDTGELWFTDNGRDHMGDEMPPCELNRLSEPGQHFGFPFCHGGDYADPEFGHLGNCKDYVSPVQNLGPHVAALGMEFYEGNQFPATYHKQVFIAEHGSWNRTLKIGYRITLVTLEGNTSTGYEPFAYGWLDEKEQSAWGRPVDVINTPDGSLLVSDDQAGLVYRIFYSL